MQRIDLHYSKYGQENELQLTLNLTSMLLAIALVVGRKLNNKVIAQQSSAV
ncbi:MAG: hypothetical protein AAF652_01225 [Cyanobacteria bacterium P01_C01_bin.72]